MQVIHSARANATHNHGLDPDRLLVGKLMQMNFLWIVYFDFLTLHLLVTAEAFVGKGFFKKRVSYHSKGRSGIKVRPECRLTIVVRELTAEEEAQIARLRVHKFRKLTKREQRLVPHQLIETTPIWNRRGKSSNREPSMNAWAKDILLFSSTISGKVFMGSIWHLFTCAFAF